jgi:serine/threonine protein kinase
MAHHDVKPENILIDSNNIFKLGVIILFLFLYFLFVGDFGNAMSFEKTSEEVKILGTLFILIIMYEYLFL